MATTPKYNLATVTTADLSAAFKWVNTNKYVGKEKEVYDKWVAAAKANDAKKMTPAVIPPKKSNVPENLRNENITTADLEEAFKKNNVDVNSFNDKQKAAYEKITTIAAANDKKKITTPDKTGGFSDVSNMPSDTVAIATLDDTEGLNSKLMEEAKKWVQILQQKADILNKPLQEQYDSMKAMYDAQDPEFQAQYDAQWKELQKYEDETRAAIKELDTLGRTQYNDYVASVARKISGRKAGVAGDLSAEWFNAKIIGNITSQIDSQYADERLKAQSFLQSTLETTLSKTKDMYTDLYNRRTNLTAAEQTFKTGLADKYKALFQLKNDIAKNNTDVFEPVKTLNDNLIKAYSTAAISTATAEGYEAQWKQSDENQKIAALSSQLHSFLGEEKNADGTSKYDTAAIPTAKLKEFAALPTQAEAFRAANDYLIGLAGGSTTTTGSGSSGSGSSSSSSSTGSSSTGAKTTGVTDTNVAQIPAAERNWNNYYAKSKSPEEVAAFLNTQPGFKVTVSGNDITGTKNGVAGAWTFDGENWKVKGSTPTAATPSDLENGKADLLRQAKQLNSQGGFAKTEDSYETYVAAINAAENQESLDKITASWSDAMKATPQAASAVSNEKIYADVRSKSKAPLTWLTASQLKVLQASPQYQAILGASREIEKLDPFKGRRVHEYYTAAGSRNGFASDYAAAEANLKKYIDQALTWKPFKA